MLPLQPSELFDWIRCYTLLGVLKKTKKKPIGFTILISGFFLKKKKNFLLTIMQFNVSLPSEMKA